MLFPLHEDERGSFQELAHSDDVQFGQLSILKINPKCVRGGHYHTRKQEWFCCIHGKCRLDLVNVYDKSQLSSILEDTCRVFLPVEPFHIHTVKNLSNTKVCELLVIASEKYNPDDADTITYNG